MLKLLQLPAMFDEMTAPQQSRWPRAPLPPGPKWTGGPGPRVAAKVNPLVNSLRT